MVFEAYKSSSEVCIIEKEIVNLNLELIDALLLKVF
jgi:hypothetical protein